MFVYVFDYDFRGQRIYCLFIRRFERRRVSGRCARRPLVPSVEVGSERDNLTAEEVGQILGGN